MLGLLRTLSRRTRLSNEWIRLGIDIINEFSIDVYTSADLNSKVVRPWRSKANGQSKGSRLSRLNLDAGIEKKVSDVSEMNTDLVDSLGQGTNPMKMLVNVARYDPSVFMFCRLQL